MQPQQPDLQPAFRLKDVRAMFFVGAFMLGGIILIALVRAAGPYVAVEPENGTLSGAAAVVSDATASGAKSVVFNAAQTACSGPVNISQGGSYSNVCYQSTDAAVPAVKISTTAPVTLDHVTIRHKGEGVSDGVNGIQLTITNSKFTGLDPGTPAAQRAIGLYRPASLVAEHNSFVDGHGIYINADNVPMTTVRIRYNVSLNIGRYTPPDCCIQFAQFDKVITAAAEIAWNKITNEYGHSAVEDNINIYKSAGTDVTHPIDIHHNLVDGAWPPSGNGDGYSGGGILLGDGSSAGAGAYGNSHHNRVLNSANYGVAIAGGHDQHAYNNRVVFDGKPDGTSSMVAASYAQGMYVWDSYSSGTTSNITAYNNAAGILRPDGFQSFWLPDCNPSAQCTGNVNLTNPTAAMEQAERDGWAAELTAAGLTVGPNW